MRRPLILGLLPALPGAILAGSCGRQPVNLGLSLTFPQGLLDQATDVTLSVFDASAATCDASTGTVSAIPTTAQVFPLANTGCRGSDAWCANIQLDRDGSNKMFAVVASKAGTPLAEGCATQIIDQDPLSVEIQAFRYLAPRCCNDGVLEPGEQCDTGVVSSCDASQPPSACGGIPDDAVCYCDCTAKEILLSVDDPNPPGLKNGPANTQSALALSFGPGGANNPEVLRAVFQSDATAAGTGSDVHEAFRGPDLYPVADPLPLTYQLQVPVLCSNVEASAGQPRDQVAPAVATASQTTVVTVYQSNQNSIGNVWDVYLSPQIPEGCADEKPCAKPSDCLTSCGSSGVCAPAVQVNFTSGGATAPRVAGGPGMVLVTWTRSDGVYGRLWSSTDGSMIPSNAEIQIAPGGSAARVAGYGKGFNVVYQGPGPGDQDGVFMRSVDPMGNVGDAIAVNNVVAGLQDQPNIAMLPDGSTLVVWHSGGDVWFQRFDATGNPAPDDQSAPLNTTGVMDMTEQQHPAAAGANGYFVVAWETPDPTSGTGSISARFVGETTGFGYNSVSGQNNEFPAVDPTTTGDRYRPAVAMSTYTAIGWEDHSAGHSGVYVRRFPPPAEWGGQLLGREAARSGGGGRRLLAEVGDGADGGDDALAVGERQAGEADAHAGVGVALAGAQGVHPLDGAAEDEGFALVGGSEAEGHGRAHGQRLGGPDEDAHLGDVGDGRVEERVLRLAVDRPEHVDALGGAAIAGVDLVDGGVGAAPVRPLGVSDAATVHDHARSPFPWPRRGRRRAVTR